MVAHICVSPKSHHFTNVPDKKNLSINTYPFAIFEGKWGNGMKVKAVRFML